MFLLTFCLLFSISKPTQAALGGSYNDVPVTCQTSGQSTGLVVNVSEPQICPILSDYEPDTTTTDPNDFRIVRQTRTNPTNAQIQTFTTRYTVTNNSNAGKSVRLVLHRYFCPNHGYLYYSPVHPVDKSGGSKQGVCLETPQVEERTVFLNAGQTMNFDLPITNTASETACGTFQSDFQILSVDGNTDCRFGGLEVGQVAAWSVCETGVACQPSIPRCGNGRLESGEQCDDGNMTNGDGCNGMCQLESQLPRCGNGQLETGEQCDAPGASWCDAQCRFVQTPPQPCQTMCCYYQQPTCGGHPGYVYYPDCPHSHMFYTYIYQLTVMGHVGGYTDGNFYPDRELSRGEAAAMVVKTLDIPMNTTCGGFGDVGMDNKFYPYITTLKCNGLVNGYRDGTFRSDERVNRGSVAKMINNGLEYKKVSKYVVPGYGSYGTSPFVDVKAGDVFYREIINVQANGIANGTRDGRYMPDKVITRGEMARMMYGSAVLMK